MDFASMNYPPFVLAHITQAKALLVSRREPLFSHGTYQLEIAEKGKKKFFPFIQMKDTGEVTDFFCTCEESEKGQGCVHLAAAYLQIFNGFEEPLHVRFQKSLWYHLFAMAAERLGYSSDCIKQIDNAFIAESETDKKLFSLEAVDPKAEKKLRAILWKKEVETEETSIKFSNLSQEEIARYREGLASSTLKFELSFWSDLAKWAMFIQEMGKPYAIAFAGKPLPREITLTFPDFIAWFYIAEVHLPSLIPALKTVDSPLGVFDLREEIIRNITYDETRKTLHIERNKEHIGWEQEFGIPIDHWRYREGKGFYHIQNDPIFSEDAITEDKIGQVLSESGPFLRKFLPFWPDKLPCRYNLYFDSAANFHIELYVFEPGDLQKENSAVFMPWVYIPEKGFILLADWQFEEIKKTIPQKYVAEFINRHRAFLHQFPGFQTHLGSLESHLVYHITDNNELIFAAELAFPDEYEETHHFDEWAYIKGQGFYLKKEARGRFPIHPGLILKKEEVSSFISSHKDELEQVRDFYSGRAPILKTGLFVTLNEEGLIQVIPKMEYATDIDPNKLRRFGDYVYQPKEGFSEIPQIIRLPERYQEAIVIPESQEASFLAYELEHLKPYILHLDHRLIKTELELQIKKISSNKRKRTKEWLVDLAYLSPYGEIGIIPIWNAMQEKKRYLFSAAGLLSLKETRFNWIRQLPKKRIDPKRGLIRLNTMEWMRLITFESIKAPEGQEREAKETRKLLEEINKLEPGRVLDTSRLKATLRPYQEQGVQWLWFLYCHGLSGLLCDDMGLGKTHQAMALMAAIIDEDSTKEHKYLVVCPTSVIYHWQELLKKFLPTIRVCTFYGLERSLHDFEANYDLLLTSYGILRLQEKQAGNIHSHRYELAIFDEIQIAKNQKSQTHKALRAIKSQMKLGLTGTPIENRIRELKSLFDVVLPGYMPADPIFREMFIQPIEKGQDPEKKALLSKLVKPFILRRKKSEVLTDLPEKMEEIAYCDLSPEQKELYKGVAYQMRDTVYQELKDRSKPVSFVHVFSALAKLKQICNHPSLIVGDAKQFAKHESGKWDLFVELLQEARESGQKVVVFSQYLEMLHIIELYLKKKGIGFATIKGSTRDRPEQLRRFREDPQCEVFVASLLAAGVGIDLTVASIVIHYDRWWNPAKENQATDRVHRYGQNRGVQVFKLVTKHTIEEYIHEMIERKKGLLEDIIGTEDQINYLSREELLQVFERMFSENQ